MVAWAIGASIGVAGAIAAAVGLAADGTGIASALTEESDPQASATLGWVSLGLGIASGVVGAGAAIAGERAAVGMTTTGAEQARTIRSSTRGIAAAGSVPTSHIDHDLTTLQSQVSRLGRKGSEFSFGIRKREGGLRYQTDTFSLRGGINDAPGEALNTANRRLERVNSRIAYIDTRLNGLQTTLDDARTVLGISEKKLKKPR